MKRFYKAVETAHGAVLLDGKKVRTPGRNNLVLPTAALAEAIAAEWRAQETKILPRTMPLTALANAAIDRIPEERDAVIAVLAGFGAHDLLCYRSADAVLAMREAAAWDPLLVWARARYGAPLMVTTGVAPIVQPAHGPLGAALADYDDFTLAGLSPIVSIAGSLVLGLAFAEGRIDAGAAFALSRLDEAWQAEKWGMDAEAERRAAALEQELASAAAFIVLARA